MSSKQPSNTIAASHWSTAAERWQHYGPPLRPCAEDIESLERAVTEWVGNRQGCRALMFGVTPEIATMRWPAGLELVALDRSEAMITGVWPGDVPGKRRALQGDWLAPPFESGYFDAVVGDGCLTLIDFPDGYRRFLATVARMLRPGGRAALRCFVQGAEREATIAVVAALRAGAIGSFHAFKWRLAMALQESTKCGVPVQAIHDAWRQLLPDGEQVVERLGWPSEVISTIEVYRGSPDIYFFPTLPELQAVARERFVVEDVLEPGYELGGRCPTLLLSVR